MIPEESRFRSGDQTVSLVITTYNWKEALALSIGSALAQTHLPREILIADDGSTGDTRQVVEDIAATASVPIRHLWQEDKGFRASRCRNQAIAKATGEYVILIDGDMILEKHFIEDHLNAAEETTFVQGSRVLITTERTRQILAGEVLDFSILSAGIENRKNCIRSALLSTWFSHRTASLKGIRTCNFGFWRRDALKVNGFNEDFEGWGREDSEFAVRLMNSGVQRKNLKFKAVAFHLDHQENTRGFLADNEKILAHSIRNRLTRCPNGIDKHL